MLAVNLIIQCFLSTGPAYLIANYEDSQAYYTITEEAAASHPTDEPGLPIPKEYCKLIWNEDTQGGPDGQD